jgi:hypothetical protein
MIPKSFVQVMKWGAGDYQQCSTIKKRVRVVLYTVVHLSVNMKNATQRYYPILHWNADDSNDRFLSAAKHKIIKKCKIPVINLHFIHF